MTNRRASQGNRQPLTLTFVTLLLLTQGLLSGWGLPCDNLEAQPGDDKLVTVTVRELRVALCYADAYDAEHVAYTQLGRAYEKLQRGYEIVSEELLAERAKVSRMNVWIALLGSAAGGTAIGWLVSMLLKPSGR